MIYLFNEGGPGSVGNNAGSTDMPISWVYKLTTGQSLNIMFLRRLHLLYLLLLLLSLIIFSRSNAFQMED